MSVQLETSCPLSSFIFPEGRLFLPALQDNNVQEAHLAIAGEGGVIKQKVGTKEEDNSIKHPQACPIQEDRPAEEGVLRYVPTENGRGIKKYRRSNATSVKQQHRV